MIMEDLHSSAELLNELFMNWIVNKKMFFRDIHIENLKVNYTSLILWMELFEELQIAI